MIDSNLLTLIYFFPLVVLAIYYARAVKRYFKLYREKRKPNFPLLGEASAYFIKDPLSFILRLPMIPFLWWKIIFEKHKHKDKELHEAAKQVRNIIFIFIGYFVLQFILFLLTV